MVRIGMNVVGDALLIQQLREAKEALGNDVVWTVGTPMDRGLYQEVGTSFHPPQPWLRPAANSGRRRMETILSKHDDFDDGMEALAMYVRDEAKKNAPVRTGELRESIHAERRK